MPSENPTNMPTYMPKINIKITSKILKNIGIDGDESVKTSIYIRLTTKKYNI